MKLVWPLLIALGLVSCSQKRAARGPSKEKMFTVFFRADARHFRGVIQEPVDTVWRAIPAVFQSLRFPGAPSVYHQEYVYLTPPLKIEDKLYEGESNSQYLNCGYTPVGVPAADNYQVVFAILARLIPQGSGSTEVDIIVDGEASNLAERSPSVHCTGTGRLEETLFRRLQTVLDTTRR